MNIPGLNRIGRALPFAWQQAILRRSRGVDLGALASDLFLDYLPDELKGRVYYAPSGNGEESEDAGAKSARGELDGE